jgi:hypothetical protein
VGRSKFQTMTGDGALQCCAGGQHASRACTVRKFSRTRVGVDMSYGMGDSIKSLAADDEEILTILSFEATRKY